MNRELTDLEIAARECLRVSKNANNIWSALGAHNAAIKIRNLPNWKPYK